MDREFLLEVRVCIQALGVILALESAYFLLRSNLRLTPKAIYEATLLFWGGQVHNIRPMCRQKAEAAYGLALLLASFAAQAVITMWPPAWSSFSPSPAGLVAALLIGSLSLWIASQAISKHAAVLERAVDQVRRERENLIERQNAELRDQERASRES